jgi:hypothetical protein
MLSVLMNNAFILRVRAFSIIMLSVDILSVIFLSVIMPSVAVPNVVGPLAGAQRYKTFYARNFRMFVISWSVCFLQASPA